MSPESAPRTIPGISGFHAAMELILHDFVRGDQHDSELFPAHFSRQYDSHPQAPELKACSHTPDAYARAIRRLGAYFGLLHRGADQRS